MARLDFGISSVTGHMSVHLQGQYDERYAVPAVTAIREYEERFETTQRRNPDMTAGQVSAFVLDKWYEDIKGMKELEQMVEVEP